MKTRILQLCSPTCALVFALLVGHAYGQPIRRDDPSGTPSRPDLVTQLEPRTNNAANLKAPTGVLAEVEKMVQGGADAEVIKAYIQNWSGRYYVTADHILHLHGAGVSSDILTTLIRRSAELQAQAASAAAASAAAARAAITNVPAVTYPEMAVAPPGTTDSYASPYPAYTYSYAYPYSALPYSYYYSYSYPYWSIPYTYTSFYWWPAYRSYYWPYRHWYGHHYRYPYYGHYKPPYYGHRPNFYRPIAGGPHWGANRGSIGGGYRPIGGPNWGANRGPIGGGYRPIGGPNWGAGHGAIGGFKRPEPAFHGGGGAVRAINAHGGVSRVGGGGRR